MGKKIFLLLALALMAHGPGLQASDDIQTVVEHYTKSGSIPTEEAKLIMMKNYQFLKKEKYLFPSRKIASDIQHTHIIRIINTPLEIKAQ